MLDLPEDYVEKLDSLSLKALWGSRLKSLMPDERPTPGTVSAIWRYSDIRPHMMRAGELTTAAEAERRGSGTC